MLISPTHTPTQLIYDNMLSHGVDIWFLNIVVWNFKHLKNLETFKILHDFYIVNIKLKETVANQTENYL